MSNLTAPVALVQALEHQVNEQDVQALIQSQKHMLVRFEKTNEMLTNCNSLLAVRYGDSNKELKKHIQLLVEMKKDLDSIFHRIQFLKTKLSQQHPEAFSACRGAFNILDEEEEQDERSTASLKNSEARNLAAPDGSSSGSQGSSTSPKTSPSTSDSG